MPQSADQQRVTDAQYMPSTSLVMDSVPQNSSGLIPQTSDQQFSPMTTAASNSMNSFAAYAPSAPESEIKTAEFAQSHDSVRHDSAYGSYTTGAVPVMRNGGYRAENFQQQAQDLYNFLYDRNAAIPEWQQHDNVSPFSGRTAV